MKKKGLKEFYPMVARLLASAAVLPLSTAEVERVFSQLKLVKTGHSTAEVERVFSQLKLVKTGHRSCLKTSTLTKLITKTCLFKYIENFTTANCKFSDKKKNPDIFSHFRSKHRLWVLVRTASARRF